MENKEKRWFFYNEKGEVYLIYIIEPPKEILSENACVEGVETFKQGCNTVYTVDLKTKELKPEYIKKPLTVNEQIKQMQDAIDIIMMGGMK